MTTSQAKVLRLILAGAGLLLLFGGCSVANANTRIEYVCLGSAFECAVDRSPQWVTPLSFASAIGGPLLLIVALLTRSSEEQRQQQADIDAYVQRGRDVIATVRDRDGGACAECGATDGTDVVYRTMQVPAVRDPQRYNPTTMMVVCKAHRTGLPIARGVLGVPVGGSSQPGS